MVARRGEAWAGRGAASVRNVAQGVGAQQVDGGEEQVRGHGLVGGRGEEGEEREEERGLVVDAAVVGGDIVEVEVETLVHWQTGVVSLEAGAEGGNVHVLKLDTGVDSSTRPARRAGSWGKAWNSSKRSAAAATKRAALCLEAAEAAATRAIEGQWAHRRADEGCWVNGTSAVKGLPPPERAPPRTRAHHRPTRARVGRWRWPSAWVSPASATFFLPYSLFSGAAPGCCTHFSVLSLPCSALSSMARIQKKGSPPLPPPCPRAPVLPPADTPPQARPVPPKTTSRAPAP